MDASLVVNVRWSRPPDLTRTRLRFSWPRPVSPGQKTAQRARSPDRVRLLRETLRKYGQFLSNTQRRVASSLTSKLLQFETRAGREARPFRHCLEQILIADV